MKTSTIFDRALVRPFLKVTTWAKRRSMLALAILAILFFLPPLLFVTYKAVEWIHRTLSGWGEAGKAAAEQFRKAVIWINDQVRQRPWIVIVFFILIAIPLPMLGVVLFLWRLLDRFKKPVTPEDVGLTEEPAGKPTTPTVPKGGAQPENVLTFPVDIFSDDPFGLGSL